MIVSHSSEYDPIHLGGQTKYELWLCQAKNFSPYSCIILNIFIHILYFLCSLICADQIMIATEYEI